MTREVTTSTPSNGSSRTAVRMDKTAAASASFFLHSVRVLERELLFLVGQSQQRQKLVATAADGLARHEMNAADEGEILARRQVVEQRQIFRNDADVAFGIERLALVEHVSPQHRESDRSKRRAVRSAF